MRVSQISIGRFHHFNLARQLEKRGWLEAIHTGYPRFKLADEVGIPLEKIRSFPWLQAPYMARGRFGLDWPWLSREWAWWANETLDQHAAGQLATTDVLIALSGSGLHSGRAIQRQGGKYICDRGSAHIRYQDELLREEHRRWGVEYRGIDPRMVAKEEAEYELAERITVPSEFARRSFIEQGIPESKLSKIPYGARLERFRPVGSPDESKFTVLFVGNITLQKGFPYLLEAFSKLRHPRKELIVIGTMGTGMAPLMERFSLENVKFLGNVPNADLPAYYSRAHVFILPSIQEGFGMVMAEAMACGCPVIASENTGARDLFAEGVGGCIVASHDSMSILNSLQRFMQDEEFARESRSAALGVVVELGGWNEYGERMAVVLAALSTKS